MSILEERHRAGLEAVDEWLREAVPQAARLTQSDLGEVGFAYFESGWRLPLPTSGVGGLLLLLDGTFPYSLPRIAVVADSPLLQGPHVEKDGLLCLAGDGAAVSTLEPVEVVRYSLFAAEQLLKQNADGGNTEDFKVDFEAYWRRTVNRARPSLYVQLNDRPPSRSVYAWHGIHHYLVAETRDDVQSWMENRYGPDKNRTVRKAALVWLRDLPEPNQYPDTGQALRKLVAAQSPDSLRVLDCLLASEPARALVVLLGRTPLGRVVTAGVELQKPNAVRGKGRHVCAPLSKGFRPGRVPGKVLASRYSHARVALERVDSSRSRMDPSILRGIEQKTVVVIGCGSLGASIARILVQSGVARMVLVDPDTLAWANIGRHELGAECVGQGKASSLAKHLRGRFPHVKKISASDCDWRAAYRANPALFRDADIVVAATGDWNAESALNDLQRSGELRSPIVYGWMEARAAAAHALVISGTGACLRCGFGPTGTLRTPATLWPDGAEIAECGGGTSVYGAIELAQAQSLVASATVDVLLDRVSAPVRRVWLAPSATLVASGGMWNPEWQQKFGPVQAGGVMTATQWPEEPGCPSCGAMT